MIQCFIIQVKSAETGLSTHVLVVDAGGARGCDAISASRKGRACEETRGNGQERRGDGATWMRDAKRVDGGRGRELTNTSTTMATTKETIALQQKPLRNLNEALGRFAKKLLHHIQGALLRKLTASMHTWRGRGSTCHRHRSPHPKQLIQERASVS